MAARVAAEIGITQRVNMAQLVLGLGTSHSPQLSMPPETWAVRAERFDARRSDLVGTDGRVYKYQELLSVASPSIQQEITLEKMQARYEANQRGMTRIAEVLQQAEPDVLVMVGDDQQQVIKDDNMPAISVYWGETVLLQARKGSAITADRRLEGYTETDKTLPIASDLGLHIIEYLIEAEFDAGNSRFLPSGVGISECFAFVYNRIMNEHIIPTVPIWLNTYYPPSQPTPRRCYQLGRALRGAIEAWKGNARVAILASGGLSHFVVDEGLDQIALEAMRRRDMVALSQLPRERLNSGNSEIRNWIVIAGACEHFDMTVIDYVPCYRSPAGTGCAMGFAYWD